MSLNQAKRFKKVQGQSPSIVTLRSLTLCLAYIHHYTPTRLAGARLLSPTHLRTLSEWLGYPLPKLRRLKNQPVLALHLYLLSKARLLILTPTSLHLSPDVTGWLHEQTQSRIAYIVAAANSSSPDQDFENMFHVTATYLQNSCQRFGQETKKKYQPALPAQWLETSEESVWQLNLPASLPDWLLFDLLQMGHFCAPHALQITALTIASQAGSAYGFDQIRWLLETALQEKLTMAYCEQLGCWLRRGTAYQLTGNLLTTAKPKYLGRLLQNRRLRTCVQEQLSPRHALLVPQTLPRLQRWLSQKGYPLTGYVPQANQPGATLDPAYQWLGLQLLILLQKQMRLPYPAPHEQLARLSASLPPESLAHLQAVAQQMNQNLTEISQQRDAYFPALSSPTPQLQQLLAQAIAQNKAVTIYYRTRGDRESKQHEVEPYWLEQREQLYYLHGYSYRAEAQLTFRLDRITQIEANH